jgi:hypothetical protein
MLSIGDGVVLTYVCEIESSAFLMGFELLMSLQQVPNKFINYT